MKNSGREGGKSESGYKEAIYSSHFSNCKIIFYEIQFEKKNQSSYPRNFLKASFTVLRIVWQNMTYERYENRETMGTKSIN